MTVWQMCECKKCGKESMIEEGEPLKCLHCKSSNLKVKFTVLKDIKL